MKTWGIIAAAGSGARLGAQDVPKAFLVVREMPMFLHSWRAMVSIESPQALEGVVVVVPAGWESHAKDLIEDHVVPRVIVAGGDSRQASVHAALAEVPSDVEAVVVHDAARPFAHPSLFEEVLNALSDGVDGAIVGRAIFDTVKRAPDGVVAETVSRQDLWRVQTPQAFRADQLRSAHAHAEEEGFEGTDDAALVERIGGRVVVIEGSRGNLKITTRGDLIRSQSGPVSGGSRFGTGFDAHEFISGRALVIGGVEIPFDRGLAGHSDADVLLHAIGDAILGAAGLGDLGAHFPSDDARWKDASSVELLRKIDAMLAAKNWGVHNVDATVIIEAPAMAPFRDQMRARIADALDIAVVFVNVKATTTDGLGIVGTGGGAAAQAIVSVGPRLGSETGSLIAHTR